AAGDRRRPHPHRNHRGKVEWRDPGDDAERLPDRIHVDAGRRLLRVAALEQLGNTAAVLDHLETARDLALRVAEDLAMLGREDARDVVLALVDELADAEEDRRLLRQRRRTPRGKRLLRRLHRAVDLLHGREVDGTRLATERGVVDGPATAGLTGDSLAADPVADAPDTLFLLDGRCCQLGHLEPPRATV